MGYWKDNFPGSPAALQRSRIAKGLIGYTLIAGGLIYTFSPFSKQFRKDVNDGLWDDPQWLKDNRAVLQGKGLSGTPSKKRLQKTLDSQDKQERRDWSGPSLKNN